MNGWADGLTGRRDRQTARQTERYSQKTRIEEVNPNRKRWMWVGRGVSVLIDFLG